MPGQHIEHRSDLPGQFPGRDHHNTLDTGGGFSPLGFMDPVDDRNRISRRLSGAGLGHGQYIFSLENGRDGLELNVCGPPESGGSQVSLMAAAMGYFSNFIQLSFMSNQAGVAESDPTGAVSRSNPNRAIIFANFLIFSKIQETVLNHNTSFPLDVNRYRQFR